MTPLPYIPHYRGRPWTWSEAQCLQWAEAAQNAITHAVSGVAGVGMHAGPLTSDDGDWACYSTSGYYLPGNDTQIAGVGNKTHSYPTVPIAQLFYVDNNVDKVITIAEAMGRTGILAYYGTREINTRTGIITPQWGGEVTVVIGAQGDNQ